VKIALILSIFLLVGPVAGLWAKGAGTSGAIILDQPGGARASGMGLAYTAVGGEIGVLNYNPAGLISLSRREVSFSYQRGLANDTFMSLLYGQPSPLGVFGGGFSYYTVGDIELMDLEGNEWTVKAEQDFVIVLGFAREFLENLPMGINLKIISSKLVEVENATAFAVDLGGLYYPAFKGLNIGLAIRNLGTNFKYIDGEDPLPLTISLGSAYQRSFGKQKILLSIDFPYQVYEQLVTPAIGFEFDWREMIQGRIGYRFNIDDTGLTLGMGITYRNYLINYALSLADKLESAHRINLGVRF
jgi:hypothetical protein